MIDIKTTQPGNKGPITVALAGDVMTGRGIDQILPHPGDPTLYEDYIKDARGYVELAEGANGPVPRLRDRFYIWGDVLSELEKQAPDVRIINLETAVTKSNEYWKWKEVHYRMNTENIDCITAARIDVCSLANNHILDWGYKGLKETLLALEKAAIKSVGAGISARDAAAPVIVEIEGKGRLIVLAYGSPTSGVRLDWGATEDLPGINVLADYSETSIRRIAQSIRCVKKEGDIVICSLHWGGNWGYDVHPGEIRFAHRLIESGVDIIHGHSSHHVKAIEVYRDRPIFYGCGDLLNDYEGITGHEYYRGDLGLMYLVKMEPVTGKLVGLRMIPTRIRNLRINRASREEALWLADILSQEGRRFGTEATAGEENTLTLIPAIHPGIKEKEARR